MTSTSDGGPAETAEPEFVIRRVGPLVRVAEQTPASAMPSDNHFAGALLTLWHTAAVAGPTAGFDLGADRSALAPLVTDMVNGIRAGKRHAVAALANRDLVGAAVIVPEPTPLGAHTARLTALILDPRFKAASISAPLLDGVKRLLVDLRIELLLAAAPEVAAEHYRELGFVEFGRLPDGVHTSTGSTTQIHLVLRVSR